MVQRVAQHQLDRGLVAGEAELLGLLRRHQKIDHLHRYRLSLGIFLEILSRLLAEVSVQKFNPARESRSIVFRTERLNDKLGFFLLASQLTPHPFFVAFRGGTSGFVGRRRIQEGIHKHIARFVV